MQEEYESDKDNLHHTITTPPLIIVIEVDKAATLKTAKSFADFYATLLFKYNNFCQNKN